MQAGLTFAVSAIFLMGQAALADQEGHSQPTIAGDSCPKQDWPRELTDVIDGLRAHRAEPKYVDVRFADPDAQNPHSDGGFYWRMPADKATVNAHIQAFSLKKTAVGTKEVGRMYDRYPKDWPKPQSKELSWYAWPYNRDDVGISAHFWKIMLHDEKSHTLYFYYWIWDIGI